MAATDTISFAEERPTRLRASIKLVGFGPIGTAKAYLSRKREERRKDRERALWEEAVRMYDITVREHVEYLDVNGTLIPADHLADADATLTLIRREWVERQLGK